MGVMKRLYTLHGKGLPTDGPTVLRAPGSRLVKSEPRAAPSKPEPPEPKRYEVSTDERDYPGQLLMF